MDSCGYVGVWYTSVPGRRGLCADSRVLLLSGDTMRRVAVARSSRMLSDSSELQSAGNPSVEAIPVSPSEMRHGSGSRAFEGEGLYNMQLLVYQPLSQLV